MSVGKSPMPLIEYMLLTPSEGNLAGRLPFEEPARLRERLLIGEGGTFER